MITTERTRILVAPLAALRALVEGDRVTAGALIDAQLPDDWPGSVEGSAGLSIHLAMLEAFPDQLPWRVRIVIAGPRAIGSINFKGPPDRNGDVEIGWGLVAAARGCGLATEAARAVIGWAFTAPQVRRVIATIEPDHERSQAVALRLGMQPVPELRNQLPVWALSA
jgi:[ribosomal protein S5]-alanine N-acetyltransferase